MTDFKSKAHLLTLPITGLSNYTVPTETVTIPAGNAGVVVDFYVARKPIIDSNGYWIGGFGDTSLVLTSTAFNTEVKPSTEDADMANGEYWINYVTGRGRGKKADNSVSMSADYLVFLSGLAGGGTIYGDLTIAGNLTVEETVEFSALSANTFLVDGGQMIIDTDNAEAFLVRKDGDLGDIFNIDTIAEEISMYSHTDFHDSIEQWADASWGGGIITDYAEGITTGASGIIYTSPVFAEKDFYHVYVRMVGVAPTNQSVTIAFYINVQRRVGGNIIQGGSTYIVFPFRSSPANWSVNMNTGTQQFEVLGDSTGIGGDMRWKVYVEYIKILQA